MSDKNTNRLNGLSPQALEAALTGGAAEWGQWASASQHVLYVEPITTDQEPVRRRRMCRCGCRKKQTHRAAANGIMLAGGCELSMRRWVKGVKRG